VIAGKVSADGVPFISIPISGQEWQATIDTGFNGELELPEGLRSSITIPYIGQTRFSLAAGQTSIEDTYLVNFPFDGKVLVAEATFTPGSDILIGTGLIRDYKLIVNFPNRTLSLERVRLP
jgi:predicted aspartyl protease